MATVYGIVLPLTLLILFLVAPFSGAHPIATSIDASHDPTPPPAHQVAVEAGMETDGTNDSSDPDEPRLSLILFPEWARTPNLSLYQSFAGHGQTLNGSLLLTNHVMGNIGADPGVWQQAAGLTRATLWFLLGRQRWARGDRLGGVHAFERMRRALTDGGLLARTELLSSVALLNGTTYALEGTLESAVSEFQTLMAISPDDQSEAIPEGPARQLYLQVRVQARSASRATVAIDLPSEDASLFINGVLVRSRSMRRILEIPPGKHFLAASMPGARPASRLLVLIPPLSDRELSLRPQPGISVAGGQQPFSLLSAQTHLKRIVHAITQSGADAAIVLAVAATGPILLDGQRTSGSSRPLGRHQPGPDLGKASRKTARVPVESFIVTDSGEIKEPRSSVLSIDVSDDRD